MDKKYENILDRLEILEKNEKIHSLRIEVAKSRDKGLLSRVKELEYKTEQLEKDLQEANREIYRLKKGDSV
ncbi:hypothetical protein [uncultured Granulicatella sp.]|uniref:hypothetical protein n=1 Tax=uncultured Granulicatella sp. TaxID=316089 RepID=UPI0028D4B6BB|nr:hypothetical protein [uncultured Granulicatella sp.]